MRRKLLSFVAALLSAVMVIGTVETSAAVSNANGAPVYVAEDSSNLLGMAADFGIFADTIKLTGHVASNVACNSLRYNGLDATAYGVFYAKEFVDPYDVAFGANTDYIRFLASVDDLDVYVGSDYKLERVDGNNAWNVTGKNGRTVKISKGGNAKTITFHNEDASTPFINIDAELATLKQTAVSLAAMPAVGASFSAQDQNERKIEVTGAQSVLNLSYNDLKQYDTPLYITGIKGTGNTVIINIKDIPAGVKSVSTPQIYLDGKNRPNNNAESCAEYTSQVLWNFGSYSGTVYVDREFGGTILAPAAFVDLHGGNIVGSVIAKSFQNGSEVHFIPYKGKKIEQPSEVTVSVESVDGTCCPATVRLSFSAALYKLNPATGKYKKQGGTKVSPEGFLTWTIKNEGTYYIREFDVQENFVQTPIKCIFSVEKDENGILRIYPKKNASESKGESQKYTVNKANTDLTFKLRHYSDSMYFAAYSLDEKEIALHSFDYSFEVINLDTAAYIRYDVAQGLSEAYEMYEAHMTAGHYAVNMYRDNELIEAKCVDVYVAPVGSLFFVERDNEELANEYERYLGTKLNMTKIKKSDRDQMQRLAKENPADFAMMTDGCLFFNIEGSTAEAGFEDDIIVFDAENADIIS